MLINLATIICLRNNYKKSTNKTMLCKKQMNENKHNDLQQNLVKKYEIKSKFWSSFSYLPFYLPSGS